MLEQESSLVSTKDHPQDSDMSSIRNQCLAQCPRLAKVAVFTEDQKRLATSALCLGLAHHREQMRSQNAKSVEGVDRSRSQP